MARAAELNQQPQAHDVYVQLCRRFIYTYYCQLARESTQISLPDSVAAEPSSTRASVNDGELVTGVNSAAAGAVTTRA
ncbi:hypothetical protein EMGBD2_09750 [Nitrospirota bacterium]|nr:hypothetical protein EMGBD2_09750 [Nitrospirota bacterium]